jgi:TolA-binding protein
MDFFEKFGERRSAATESGQAHYLLGLAKLGLGDRGGAAEQFKAALTADPNHAAAARRLRGTGF